MVGQQSKRPTTEREMASADKMSIDKDARKDDSEESMSSPEPEQTQQNTGPSNTEAQPPRRKGGRKPVSVHLVVSAATVP